MIVVVISVENTKEFIGRTRDMEMKINLNELICDNFVDVACDIINCEVDRAVLKGGRASTKSQVASECIIAGCMVIGRVQ